MRQTLHWWHFAGVGGSSIAWTVVFSCIHIISLRFRSNRHIHYIILVLNGSSQWLLGDVVSSKDVR